MGFLLLDRPNPYGNHFYPTRNNRLLAIVVHITAGADDLDTLNDQSAENVSHYAATTDRDVSWHSGSDADSWVYLLPASYTAWHASNYNSVTYGHEISKRTTDWRNVPENWVDKTLRMAALGPDGKSGLRKIALDNRIPFRWATKAELDHARATGGGPVGFITHAEIQWDDRRDPGYVTEGGRVFDTFPRARFMALLSGQPDQEDDIVDEAQENRIVAKTVNAVFGRQTLQLQFNGGRVGVSFQGAVDMFDYRAQACNEAVIRVAKQIDAQNAVLRQIAEQDDRVTLDPADLATLGQSVRAELEEQAAEQRAQMERHAAELREQVDQSLDELAAELDGKDAAQIRRALRDFFGVAVDAADSTNPIS